MGIGLDLRVDGIGLIRAEELARRDPARATHAVAARLGREGHVEAVQREMKRLKLRISLDQFLLTSLEDEARWAITSGLTQATEVPDYLGYVYSDALQAVKPEAMTIIH